MKRYFPLLAVILWALTIFATSCTFIERQIFIDFVARFLPDGFSHRTWISFWQIFGIVVVKTYHVLEYALLCFLLYRAALFLSKKHERALAFAVLFSLSYAISDEWHQTFVPGRGGTWVDVCIDSLGIGFTAFLIARHFRRSLAT